MNLKRKQTKKETLSSIEEYSLEEHADNLLQTAYEKYLKEAAERNPEEVKQLANETASVLNTMITS